LKKIISLVLAVTLFVAVGIVTANADVTSLDDTNSSAYSTVTFTQPSTYCIFIPDVIDLDSQFCISGTVNIMDYEKLCVTITNLDENNALTFTHQDGVTTLKRAITSYLDTEYSITLQDLGLPSNCVGYFQKGDYMSEVVFGLADEYTELTTVSGLGEPPAGAYYSTIEFEVTMQGN